MKVNALRTMLVCSFMFKNPYSGPRPKESRDSLGGLEIRRAKGLWNPDL